MSIPSWDVADGVWAFALAGVLFMAIGIFHHCSFKGNIRVANAFPLHDLYGAGMQLRVDLDEPGLLDETVDGTFDGHAIGLSGTFTLCC